MRQLIRLLLPLVVSTLAGLFIAELIVRSIRGEPLIEKLPLSRVRPDPQVGWTMLPGDFHFTYTVPVKINALGFRGPEPGKKKPSEYRILVIGDSHIYGQGLRDEELLTSRLNNLLANLDSSHEYNIVNLGVRAYSMNNEIELIKQTGLQLDPDHLLWCFYIDDFNRSNIDLWYEKFKNFDWYTFDLLDKPNTSVRWRWHLRQLLRKSAFLMSLHDAFRTMQVQLGYRNSTEQKILKGIADSETKDKIQYVKDSFDELKHLSATWGFRVTLVLIPEPSQLAADYPNNLYQKLLFPYAREIKLDTVDLLPALRNHYLDRKRLPLLPFDGHYNANGQSIMADVLANYFLKNKFHE